MAGNVGNGGGVKEHGDKEHGDKVHVGGKEDLWLIETDVGDKEHDNQEDLWLIETDCPEEPRGPPTTGKKLNLL
jgi:hypothetical protein